MRIPSLALTAITLVLSLYPGQELAGARALQLTVQDTTAAPADSLELQEIIVQATRYELNRDDQPVRVRRFGSDELSLYRGESLSKILEEQSGVFVRNYGPGGLSTLSLRGMNPSQTQVLWNGFRINDPLNGLIDFSLVPAGFINTLEVNPGSISTSHGSGAPGGTIHLDSGFRSREAAVWQTAGSFGKNTQGVSGAWHSGSWYGSLMFQRESSDNDFQFRAQPESSGSSLERRTHNAIDGLHGLVSAGMDRSDLKIGTTFWWYDVENQIPGSLHFPSQALQTDRAFRWLNRAEWSTGRHELDLSLLMSRIHQGYDDSFSEPNTNRSRQVSGELSWTIRPFENLALTQVAGLSATAAETPFFEGDPSQIILSLQTNPVWEVNERLRLFPAVRYDYYEISGDAVSASLGFNYRLQPEKWILRGQVSRNFVAPAFNDLFWMPNGNPDLKPEINRKAEAGILYKLNIHSLRVDSEFSLFSGRHFDGIRWVPEPAAGGMFRAHNVDEIFSRGFELNAEWDLSLSQVSGVGGTLGLRQTRSTVEAYGEGESPAIGKQLIYTPEWVFQAGISARYRLFSTGISYSWYDERFITQEHSAPNDPLDDYHLSSAWMSLSVPMGKAGLELTARARNLLDQQYQVIDGYPLPGRHFLVTARFKFSLD